MSEKQVLIVGAGPVGLFTALRLAQAGIEVNVIERLPERSTAPRAAGHYGASLMALKNAKIYEKMLAAGDLQDGFGWRAAPVPNEKGIKSLGKQLGALRIYQNEDTDAQVGGMLVLPQADFTRILEEEVLSTGKVHIHYSQELVDLDDTGSAVKITTKDTGTGKLTNFTGSYLVGADGGKSSVRKLKDIDLGGHTWPERLIATDVWLKNEEVGQPPSHFVVAPVNWGVVISLTKPTEGEYSLWRYTVSVPPEDTRTDDEVMEPASLEKFYENMMPGKRPLQQYEVLRKAIYYIHQRLASTMFRGRCLLAGDAAHLCNPIGAMGLATGVLDADAAAEALIMVLNESYPDILLGVYSDLRRHVFGFFVDPNTTQHKLRLVGNAETVEREDGLLRMLKHLTPEMKATMEKGILEDWRTDMRGIAAKMHLRPISVK